MRHNRQTHRLGRSPSERKALLENLTASLLRYQEIKTTAPKTKAAKRLVDRMITLGKTDTLTSRRNAFSCLQDHDLVSKLFKEIAPRFKSRKGGYTRILLLGRRKGDGAQLAILELTEKEIKAKEPKKSKKDSKKESKAPEVHDPMIGSETGDQSAKSDHHVAPPETHNETHFQKHPDKKDKPKKGFFRDLGKFFKNKGGS